MAKGNDGKAARERLTSKLFIGGGLLVLTGILLIFSNGSGNGSYAKGDYHNFYLQNSKNRAFDLHRKATDFRKNLHSHYNKNDQAAMLDAVLEAKITLVDLEVVEAELLKAHPNSYAGVYAHFCELNFAIHKKDPSAVPMFKDLMRHSPGCQGERFKMELRHIVDLARRRDDQAKQSGALVPKALNLTTVAFHESRCGSTLIANALIAMDPPKHRTYSESGPGAQALKSICGEDFSRCSMEQAAKILQDTVYMMSRTNDPMEERVFYKFQSITTKHVKVFQKAFPHVPWMFVYRDPVQVMMSHAKDGLHHANCVKSKKRPPDDVAAIAKRHDRPDPRHMQREEYCAAHLAGITEAAVDALDDNAIPMNYDGLIDKLYTQVLPRIWGRPLTAYEISNIQAVSQTYSKGRDDRHKEFKGDSEQKEKDASDEIREAAGLFLKESFDTLETFTPKLLERDLPVIN